jgi:stage II sporulation protein D
VTAVIRASAVRSVAALAALAAAVLAPAAAANAGASGDKAPYVVPASGTFTLDGLGYGHGHGLSQWGAYGGAKAGNSAAQILAFYYPHTSRVVTHHDPYVTVLLSATGTASSHHLEILPAPGLAVGGKTLPTTDATGAAITSWRITLSSGALVLKDKAGGSWTTVSDLARSTKVTDTARLLSLVTSSGSVASYRGSVTAEIQAGALEAVDRLRLETYIRSVVPAEMPSSWPTAALQAQAVAARTYADRSLSSPKASWFDLYGDTRDQAYPGAGSEAASTTAAVKATKDLVLEQSGKPVFAQFDAADGGWTASGGVDYLPAQKDPWDGAVKSSAHSWTTTLSAATLEKAYPSLGTLQDITVTARDGHGTWGGRVTAVTLVGSKTSIGVSGTTFEAVANLRSTWWHPVTAAS